MPEAKTNAMRMLEKEKIAYTPHIYDHGDGAIDGVSVAHKLSEPVERVFKTLVTKGASGNYFVFVIPVHRELSLKAAARSVGEKSVAMIRVDEINKVTGYIRGGCSPVGMKKFFKTTIDSTAENCETFCISAGKIGYQVELSPRDLAKVIRYQMADLTVDHGEA